MTVAMAAAAAPMAEVKTIIADAVAVLTVTAAIEAVEVTTAATKGNSNGKKNSYSRRNVNFNRKFA